MLGFAEQIHQSPRRESNAIVPVDEKVGCIPMDLSSRCNFPRPEEDVRLGSYSGISTAEGADALVHCSNQSGGQCSICG